MEEIQGSQIAVGVGKQEWFAFWKKEDWWAAWLGLFILRLGVITI